MLEREHFEVDRDAGKSQVTSKHESKSQAQRFALPALGMSVDSACKSHRLPPVRYMLCCAVFLQKFVLFISKDLLHLCKCVRRRRIFQSLNNEFCTGVVVVL